MRAIQCHSSKDEGDASPHHGYTNIMSGIWCRQKVAIPFSGFWLQPYDQMSLNV
jgi:hypothetical protein